jgi:hypothetical protein
VSTLPEIIPTKLCAQIWATTGIETANELDEFVRHAAFSSINFNNKDTICMPDARTTPEERN